VNDAVAETMLADELQVDPLVGRQRTVVPAGGDLENRLAREASVSHGARFSAPFFAQIA
jgi:hypothetical protein